MSNRQKKYPDIALHFVKDGTPRIRKTKKIYYTRILTCQTTLLANPQD
jgi:hypothetical protein